jgi:hypothetical protein
MDLAIYYKKIREVEAGLPEPCVVVSRETENGGRAGVRTEVPRRLAARMIVQGQARAATKDEVREFREAQAAAKRAADELAAARNVQVTVIPSSELRNFKNSGRAKE